jgi:hypothetical protein
VLPAVLGEVVSGVGWAEGSGCGAKRERKVNCSSEAAHGLEAAARQRRRCEGESSAAVQREMSMAWRQQIDEGITTAGLKTRRRWLCD